MREAVICEPVRTPVGRYGGGLRDVPAHQLAATAIRGIIQRTRIDPGDVDDVLLGQCYVTAEAPAIGRVAALDAGLPVEVTGLQLDRRCGSGLQTEHPRADASLETLAALRPVMIKTDSEATVTAGNASGQNDAASACVVTHPDEAGRLGLRPLARLVSWAIAGVPPRIMGIGPAPATAKALDRAGLKLSDMELIELNEAFAAQGLAVTSEWGLTDADLDRLNVHGSGISLGHPVGATGCRILTTLLREMDRRGSRYGLETMCIGGGQGLATIFERFA